MATRLVELGCDEVGLSDTSGYANPADVRRRRDAFAGRSPPLEAGASGRLRAGAIGPYPQAARAMRILFSAPREDRGDYREVLPAALERAGIKAEVIHDLEPASPETIDYIVFAPSSRQRAPILQAPGS